MTLAEAEALLTAEKLRHPNGNAFFVYQDVADALGATAVTDMPNTNFARTNVVFDTDRPVEILEAVRPDLYVKGSGYRRETLPESGLLAHLGIPVRFLRGEPDDRVASFLRRAEPGAAAS